RMRGMQSDWLQRIPRRLPPHRADAHPSNPCNPPGHGTRTIEPWRTEMSEMDTPKQTSAPAANTAPESHQDAPTAQTAPPSRKRKILLALLGAAVVAAGAAYGAYYVTVGQYHESTDDAYVSGNLVQLTPQVTGTVVAVNADDTQIVNQGDPVVTLD